jgi:hypothetical protein
VAKFRHVTDEGDTMKRDMSVSRFLLWCLLAGLLLLFAFTDVVNLFLGAAIGH